MSLPAPWDSWLSDSIGELERGSRLRELRAVSPAHADATRVSIDAATLAAWRRATTTTMEGDGHGGGFVPGDSGASATHSDPFSAPLQRSAMSASTSGRRRSTGVAPNPTAVAVADGPSSFQPPSASGFPSSALSSSSFPLSSTPTTTTTTTLTLFSTNDYLGLSTHPRVRAAAARTAASLGCGPRASALVPGAYTTAHRELEKALARLKGTEDALLFPSGFAANAAAMAALCGGGGGDGGGEGGEGASTVVVFSDELNHASIVDGARLAARSNSNSSDSPSQHQPRVKVVVYPHNDVAFLDRALSDERVVPRGARALVVTDSLFSMDGDLADLRALARLRRRHGFLLVIDEAHATLVCGPRGGGAAEALLGSGEGDGGGAGGGGVSSSDVDVHVGTLSKAFGAHGGFVACSARVRSLLANAGRPFAFSTALPAPAVAAALAALDVAAFGAAEGRALRARVWAHARRLGEALGVPVHSPIVPLVLGGEREALAASGLLLDRGLHVPAIRPPTVPRGTSRLRVSLSAAHSDEDVGRLIDALRELGFGKGGGAGGGEAGGRSRL